MLEEDKLDPRAYNRMKVHLVEADAALKQLGASSKLNAEPAFLEHLRAIGRVTCDRSLTCNFDQIDVNSTLDLVETYL